MRRLLPLVVAFAIIHTPALLPALAAAGPSKIGLAVGIIPGLGVDYAGLVLVGVLCPAEGVFIILASVMRLVEHIAGMLVFVLHLVVIDGGVAAAPMGLRSRARMV